MKRLTLLCSVLIAAWAIEPAVNVVQAQEAGEGSARKGRERRDKKRTKKSTKKNKRAADAQATPASEAAAPPESSEAKTEAKVPGAEDTSAAETNDGAAFAADDGQVRKEGDTAVKTLEFTGLDIEGQLKTPQLLYFLTRLRAEFDRPRLPHRSFMPELSRSSGERALR